MDEPPINTNCRICKDHLSECECEVLDWISVQDKLPQEGCLVLTAEYHRADWIEYRLDYIMVVDNPKESYIWCCRLVDDQSKVTHWMPIPNFPKE